MRKATARLGGGHRTQGCTQAGAARLDSSVLAHGFPLPQECIDWNREVLKRELGLSESDIVDIPQLFFLKGAYAEAFFPDMVRVPGGWVRGPAETEASGSQFLSGAFVYPGRLRWPQ